VLALVLSLGAGYLIGSLPSAALVARFKRRDIFAVGSSSMGAMNTARNLGWALGAVVLLLDLGKGALASAVGVRFGDLAGETLCTPLAAWGRGDCRTPLVGMGRLSRGQGFGHDLGRRPSRSTRSAGFTRCSQLLVLIALLRRVTLATFLTALAYPLLVYVSLVPTAPPARVAATTLGACLIALVVALKHVLPVTGPLRES
jgi:glycerol-3-phosphate acyltransferase PlsY